MLEIDAAPDRIEAGRIPVRIRNKGLAIETRLDLSAYDQRILREGGALNYLRNKFC